MLKTNQFLEQLEKGLTSSRLKRSFPLAKVTSFRVGGPAKALVEVNSLADLRHIFELVNWYEQPFFFLGQGTNVLASDLGYNGLVIVLGQPFKNLVLNDRKLVVGAGANLARVVQYSTKNGFDGLTFAIGIPGTVGGAVYGNAGAFGTAVGDIVSRATVYFQNKLQVLTQSDLEFFYRGSNLAAGMLLVEVELKLWPEKPEIIKAKLQSYWRRRKESQPTEPFTAGSVFKNPPGMVAGKLIEACGGKNWQIGGAKVSEKHANFFINTNNAKADDIYQLIVKAQKEVYNRFKVKLEPEIKFLGEFNCANH